MYAGPYDHYKYLNGNYANSLFFEPVSSADVEEIILSPRNKPGNINTFSTSVLKRIKMVKSSIARILPVENLLPQNAGSIINYLQ